MNLETAAYELSESILPAVIRDAPMDYAVATFRVMKFLEALPAEKREFMAKALPEICAFAVREAKKSLA